MRAKNGYQSKGLYADTWERIEGNGGGVRHSAVRDRKWFFAIPRVPEGREEVLLEPVLAVLDDDVLICYI